MALASNQTNQMAKRLKADLALVAPELAVSLIADATIQLTDGGSVVAIIIMQRRSFDGFNIVNELSSSVGQGFPEHDLYLAVKSDTTLERCAKLTKAAAAMGCSEMKFIQTSAAPGVADCVDANVTLVMPNDARLGSVGA